jgi:hypothetical protein
MLMLQHQLWVTMSHDQALSHITGDLCQEPKAESWWHAHPLCAAFQVRFAKWTASLRPDVRLATHQTLPVAPTHARTSAVPQALVPGVCDRHNGCSPAHDAGAARRLASCCVVAAVSVAGRG